MLARQPCGHKLSDAPVTMSYEDSHFKDKGADVRLEGSSQVWSLKITFWCHPHLSQRPYGRNPTAAPTPTSTKPPPVKPTVQFAGQSTTSTVTEDPEREKRRRRAERFGIPLVENSQNPVSGMSSVVRGCFFLFISNTILHRSNLLVFQASQANRGSSQAVWNQRCSFETQRKETTRANRRHRCRRIGKT